MWTSLALSLVLLAPAPTNAVAPPLLPVPVVDALAGEISGESAKRNLEELSRHHRMRASAGYSAAAAHIERQLRAYGLNGVEVLRFPADGSTFYGTQKARPAWD